jgi:hypothetical protein
VAGKIYKMKKLKDVFANFSKVKFSLTHTFIDSDSEEFPRLKTLQRRVPTGTRSSKTNP